MYLNTRHDSLDKSLAVFGGDALTSPHRKTNIEVSILPPWTWTLCFSFGAKPKGNYHNVYGCYTPSPSDKPKQLHLVSISLSGGIQHPAMSFHMQVVTCGFVKWLCVLFAFKFSSACTSFGWKFMPILFPHGWTLDDICVPIVWHRFVSVASFFCQ